MRRCTLHHHNRTTSACKFSNIYLLNNTSFEKSERIAARQINYCTELYCTGLYCPTQAQVPGGYALLTSECYCQRSHPTWPSPLLEYFSKTRKCPACTLNQVISALGFSKNDGRIGTSREKQLSWLLSDSSPMRCPLPRIHRLYISSPIQISHMILPRETPFTACRSSLF